MSNYLQEYQKYKDNRQIYHSKFFKKWYEEHKNEYNTKIFCLDCGRYYTKHNKWKHIKSIKHAEKNHIKKLISKHIL